MLNFENAPKRAVNLSLNSKAVEMARELGMNLSQFCDEVLEREVRRVYRAQWAEQNKDAIAAYNARIETEGTFSQQVNSWMKEQGEISEAPPLREAA
jgi:antitoxin CcdA